VRELTRDRASMRLGGGECGMVYVREVVNLWQPMGPFHRTHRSVHPREGSIELPAKIGSARRIGAMGGEDDVDPQSIAPIREAGKAYVEALNHGDAKALAALWTASGVYVDADGRSFNAHALIEQHFSDDTETENLEKVPVDSDSTIRFVTPDVAVEEGSSRATSATGEEVVTGGYSAIWVKRNDRWMLDSLREWESTSVAKDGPLDALSWIIGDWVGKKCGNFNVKTNKCGGQSS